MLIPACFRPCSFRITSALYKRSHIITRNHNITKCSISSLSEATTMAPQDAVTRPLQVAKRLEKFKTTIFTQMSSLAIEHGAINLGQGFPNFDGPEFVKEAAIQARLRRGQKEKQ
ncbi:probable N-succinyldiaminopimelate aminotransferase DapC [Tanacetum coccineum]